MPLIGQFCTRVAVRVNVEMCVGGVEVVEDTNTDFFTTLSRVQTADRLEFTSRWPPSELLL